MELSDAIDQPKTWILDLDGTIVVHNGHKEDGDALLEGTLDFFKKIPDKDVVILVTARDKKYEKDTVDFLTSKGLRIDHYIFGVSKGLRILVNDRKPDGENTAICFNLLRNEGLSKFVNRGY